MGLVAKILPRKNIMLCRRMEGSSMNWPHRYNWRGMRGIMADKQRVVHNRHEAGGADEVKSSRTTRSTKKKRWMIERN